MKQKKKISDIKNTAFYKKFYKDCLNILYNSNKIDFTFNLNDIIEKSIILENAKILMKKYMPIF